jgi:hypothetical protein
MFMQEETHGHQMEVTGMVANYLSSLELLSSIIPILLQLFLRKFKICLRKPSLTLPFFSFFSLFIAGILMTEGGKKKRRGVGDESLKSRRFTYPPSLRFSEDSEIYMSSKTREVIFGTPGCTEEMYWTTVMTGDGQKDCRDPYM